MVHADLNQYAEQMDKPDPFVLLKDKPSHIFIAQSGLIGPQGVDLKTQRPYLVNADSFALADGQDELSVPMTYSKLLEYTKIFIFKRGSYAIDEYDVVNHSGSNATIGVRTPSSNSAWRWW